MTMPILLRESLTAHLNQFLCCDCHICTHTKQFPLKCVLPQVLKHFIIIKKTSTVDKQQTILLMPQVLFCLISGIDFAGSTIGLATMYAMCSPSSGAVNEVFL